jgi:enamine deaminase RidA (YjgF/YER057c/UK114 family)
LPGFKDACTNVLAIEAEFFERSERMGGKEAKKIIVKSAAVTQHARGTATPKYKSNSLHLDMERQTYVEGTQWEPIVGYARAVRIGNIIEISGTTAVVDGEIVGKGDVYAQTKCILDKFESILCIFGAGLKNVIRTRIFCTDISQWQEIARAHGEYFSIIKPATGMYQISRLIAEDMLVEIEATAIVNT